MKVCKICNSSYSLDEFYNKKSDFSNPDFIGSSLVSSPLKSAQEYQDIKISRMTYGKKDFALDVPYVQTQDDANNLMSWLMTKITKPRKSVGVKIFSIPTIQLGDIVTIDYLDNDGINQIADPDSRFVVYNIDYSRSSDGPEMTLYLSEVV